MIPDDLRTFLSSPNRRVLMNAGEVRDVTLFAFKDLSLKSFDVNSYALFSNGELEVDPEETREYSGYDLIEHCDDYEPEGILIWFPEWQKYGTWDLDHHRIYTFPGVTWTQIATAPIWYINCQWYPDQIENREVNPWAKDA